jgi:erythromycin esterase-like protein
MTITSPEKLLDSLSAAAVPLTGAKEDYDQLMERVGDARFVLIGEASHGTQEFYQQRALITERLIEEKGFSAVAVEADWPDAYRVNRYVRGQSSDADSDQALAGFERFPAWMWRNTAVREFVDWLRSYNDALAPDATKAGFYGLDLYSLYSSIDAVLDYLGKVDPGAAARARYRYSCMEQFGRSSEAYGYAAIAGAIEPCEDEVINQLL